MRHIRPIYPTTHPGEDFIKVLSDRPDFEKLIDDIRKKWKIDVASEIDWLEKDEKGIKIDKLQKNKKFIAEVRNIQKRFKLGDEWSSFIEGYIFIDVFESYVASNLFIEKRTGKDGDTVTGKPAYYLRIFRETTQEDLIQSWEEINKFVNGKKVKRQKPSQTHIRDRQIYKLAKMGFYIEDIATYCSKWFKSKKPLEYAAIATALNRYQKRMGIKEHCKLLYKSGGKGLVSEERVKVILAWPPLVY